MHRYLADYIDKICFAHGKIAVLSGPRQAGKTTFARHLLSDRQHGAYFNWDQDSFRLNWIRGAKQLFDPYLGHVPSALVVLDEIHKDRVWKRRLKGIYDTELNKPDILVTGSARLDICHSRLSFTFSPLNFQARGIREPDGEPNINIALS